MALPLLVEVEEAVESDLPVRYSLPEGMLSAILLVVCFWWWLMVVVWSLAVEVAARVTMYELRIQYPEGGRCKEERGMCVGQRRGMLRFLFKLSQLLGNPDRQTHTSHHPRTWRSRGTSG